MNPFAGLRLHEVRDLLKKKRASPLEIVRAYRRQAEKINPQLNAIVADRWDQVYLEAKVLEKRILAGDEIPRLAGVPFTAKELFEAKGMPHTLGVERRRGVIGQVNSSMIDRMISEGAFFAGVTNVPELGFWFETQNVIYGTTNNPYDLRRTSGGSSGGEAAIIAAMGSAFGLASDVGGSIRIPAAFCGLFGHKPSRFVIPFSGHYPMVHGTEKQLSGDGSRLTVVGPIARFADDLIELFQIMAKPDHLDQDVREHDFDFSPVQWKRRKVFILPDPLIRWAQPTEGSIKEAIQKVAVFFQEQGAKVEELKSDFFYNALDLWNEACAFIKGPTITESLSYGESPQLHRSLLRMVIGRPDTTLPILVYAYAEKYLKSFFQPGQLSYQLARLRAEVSELLGRDNILVMPSHPRTAFLHNSGRWSPFDFSYAAIWNALDFPVTQVPIGFDAQSLPIGVQIVAGHLKDSLSLLAARDLEKAFGGWRAP